MSILYEHQKFKLDLIRQEKVYYVVYWCTLKGKCILKLIMKQINTPFLQEVFFNFCIWKSLLMILELGFISVVKMLWEQIWNLTSET